MVLPSIASWMEIDKLLGLVLHRSVALLLPALGLGGRACILVLQN